MNYRVRYYAGQFSGAFTLDAENADHAIALALARVRRQMPMLSDPTVCRVTVRPVSDDQGDDDGATP